MATRRRGARLATVARRTLACACAALFGVLPAAAQSRSYRALFGGGGNDATVSQLFDVTFSVAEAYDTNVLAKDSSSGGPLFGVDGFFTSVAADVRYAKRGRRAQLAINAGTNGRYFQELGEFAALGHHLGIGASLPLGRKTMLTINEAASYAPSYLFGLFASAMSPGVGDVVPFAPGYAATDRRSYTSATDLMVVRRVGQRSTLEFNSAYQWTMVSGVSGHSNLTSYEAGANWRQPVSRDLALRIGYTHREAEYSNGRHPVTHDINLGADYDRPLGRDRRTRLRFSMGTSVLDAPPPQRATAASVKQLRAVGDLLLTHQIRRTWSARLSYRRGAMFVEELSAPVFTNGVTLSTDGFLNRRTDVTTTAAYSAGEAYDMRGEFTTYTGTARVRVAANRRVAGYLEYLYYFYRFGGGVQLITGAPAALRRNSVKVGLSFWLPLLRKQ